MYLLGRMASKSILSVGLASAGLMLVCFSGYSQAPGAPEGGRTFIFDGFYTSPGLPFSARQITERTQTLADGTHITNRSEMRVFRDSRGRLRIEQYQMQPGSEAIAETPTHVEIIDTVAGYQYFLTPSAHDGARNDIGPERVIQAAPPVANGGRIGLPNSSTAADLRPKTTKEPLGLQTIEGIEAEGTKQTTTWPAHSIGNDAPIVTTNEIWRSEELKFDVLRIGSDPRSGETKVRMTGINRAEPDPSLFQVPADYTIRGR